MSFVVDDVYDSGPDGKWIQGKAAIRDRWSQMLTDPGFKLTWIVGKADASKDRLLGYTPGYLPGQYGRQTDGGQLRYRLGERQGWQMEGCGNHRCGSVRALSWFRR